MSGKEGKLRKSPSHPRNRAREGSAELGQGRAGQASFVSLFVDVALPFYHEIPPSSLMTGLNTNEPAGSSLRSLSLGFPATAPSPCLRGPYQPPTQPGCVRDTGCAVTKAQLQSTDVHTLPPQWPPCHPR